MQEERKETSEEKKHCESCFLLSLPADHDESDEEYHDLNVLYLEGFHKGVSCDRCGNRTYQISGIIVQLARTITCATTAKTSVMKMKQPSSPRQGNAMNQIMCFKAWKLQGTHSRWCSRRITWRRQNFAPGACKRDAPRKVDRPHVKIKTWSGLPPAYKPHCARGRLVIPSCRRDHFCEISHFAPGSVMA